eukprot:GILK01007681.1.p1 GENE.GILK01007681.1~~GILK01007681.1.p1  ORF type:complete len:1501 (+),score=449.51 GILK01007681.1:100-4602(+)
MKVHAAPSVGLKNAFGDFQEVGVTDDIMETKLQTRESMKGQSALRTHESARSATSIGSSPPLGTTKRRRSSISSLLNFTQTTKKKENTSGEIPFHDLAEGYHVSDFAKAQVFGDNVVEAQSVKANEAAFIPAELARQQIRQIVSEMDRMRQSHLEIIDEIERNYQIVEEETQTYYMDFLEKWKLKAKDQINEYKKILKDVSSDASDFKETATANIASLESKNATLLHEKQELLHKYLEETTQLRKEKEDTIASLTHDYTAQLTKAHEQHIQLQRELDELQDKFDQSEESTAVAAAASAAVVLELQTSKGQLEEELEETKLKLIETQKDLQDINDRISSEQPDQASMLVELKAKSTELASLRSHVGVLQSQVGSLQKQLASAGIAAPTVAVVGMSGTSSADTSALHASYAVQLASLQNRLVELRSRGERMLSNKNALLLDVSVSASKTMDNLIEQQTAMVLEGMLRRIEEEALVESISQSEDGTIDAKQAKLEKERLEQMWRNRVSELQSNLESVLKSQKDIELRVTSDSAKHETVKRSLETKINELEEKIRELNNRPPPPPPAPIYLPAPVAAVVPQMETVMVPRTVKVKKTVTKPKPVVHSGPTAEDLAAAEAELERVSNEKRRVKKDIVVWQNDFEKTQGRKPENKDKEAIRPLFVTYKDLDAQIKTHTDRVDQIKRELAEGVQLAATESEEMIEEEVEVEEEVMEQVTRPVANSTVQQVFVPSGPPPELIAELGQLRKDRDELRDELARVRTQLAAGAPSEDMAIQALRDQIASMEAEKTELRERLSKAPAQLSYASIGASPEMLQELVELRTERDHLRVQLASGRAFMGSTASSDDSAALLSQISELESERDDLKRQLTEAEDRITQLEQSVADLQLQAAITNSASAAAGSKPGAKGKAAGNDLAATLAAQQKSLAEEKVKSRALEKEVADAKKKMKELEKKADRAKTQGGGQDAVQQAREFESRLKDMEMTYKKQIKDLETKSNKEGASTELALTKAEKQLKLKTDELTKITDEAVELREKVKILSQQGQHASKELEQLRALAEEGQRVKTEVDGLKTEVKQLRESNVVLEKQYKEEVVLRKKYYNTIEDMKGKIRVYCRVRPMAGYELEKGCKPVCSIPDEYTLQMETEKGIRQFQYDQCFGPDNTQEEVFEDTKRLIQSAIDGFNVCMFAYGQTGSGKTWTIQGNHDNPGITPRAIHEIFNILSNPNFEWTVSCYMLELYLEVLVDLMLPADKKKNPPQLDIKKDAKGMVVIPNITVLPCRSAAETLAMFNQGLSMRHVGSTKMNAESSRSHLIFSLMIEVTNKSSGQRTVGKLSLVDLAGSERASKTQASSERLKEARAINKSLSALGDVISALSTGESFIPYRNNKLTQLMSDSLGGTAKTLMFVNISPADYNQDETQTSLVYASRVKLITNDAKKNVESKEMSKMKAQISALVSERDALLRQLGKEPGPPIELAVGTPAPEGTNDGEGAAEDDDTRYDEPPDAAGEEAEE